MLPADWKPSLFHYDRLVAIECRSYANYDELSDRLLETQELRAIPREEDGYVVVVPAEAVPLLPLQGIAHFVAALRNSLSLSRLVVTELEKRLCSTPPRPSYYTHSMGSCLVVWRPLVPESVVSEIERSLSRPVCS
jgi:hypothetical protein